MRFLQPFSATWPRTSASSLRGSYTEVDTNTHPRSIFPEFRNFISDFRQIEVTIHVFPRREDDSPILNPALGAKNDDLAYGQTHFQTSQPLSAPRVVFCGSFNLCTSSAS